MAVDRPCKLTYRGVTAQGTIGTQDINPNLDFNGLLIDYRFSVWATRYAFGTTNEPAPNQFITVDGTDYQIISKPVFDGAVMRLDLADAVAT